MSAMAELHLDCWRAQHEPVPILKLNRQAYAVAKLVGHCEALVGSGHLTEPSEQSLRLLIAETLSAFNMVPHDQLENEVAAVRQCMERS